MLNLNMTREYAATMLNYIKNRGNNTDMLSAHSRYKGTRAQWFQTPFLLSWDNPMQYLLW